MNENPAADGGRLTIVIIDDHPLFARGLRLLLDADTSLQLSVVGVTDRAAVDPVRRYRPDIALVDLAMPPPGGDDAIRAVRRAHPEVRVLALSGTADAPTAAAALRAGAQGFLPRRRGGRTPTAPHRGNETDPARDHHHRAT